MSNLIDRFSQIIVDAAGPCPACGKRDFWFNGLPLTAYCSGPKDTPHPMLEAVIPRPHNPYDAPLFSQWLPSDENQRMPAPFIPDPPADLTVRSVVESAYAWANGDMALGNFVADEDCETRPFNTGDGLLDFILRETQSEEVEPNSPEHWLEAWSRMRQVQREVDMVVAALEKLAPAGAFPE